MAERFNLTAQLQLQAPTNTQQVVGQIRRQLQGINVNVAVKGNVRQVASINKELQNVNRAAKNSAKSVGNLNRTLADSARRFSVITIATGSFLSLARAIKNSVGSAVEFQREMVRISQVTGQSLEQLEGISKEVTRLSTQLGVANRALLETSRVLAQAGFNARQVRESLDILAKTTLAPTFDNIKDTTEGAIALLRQFGKEATRTGTEIQFLEQSLDAINAVSKRFAVESSDLITAVRRTGGVFEAAGGNINELIALFTSVRSTTRESAETIATGFRTIFTRLQRTETIDQLRELGITLQDTEGKFIGPLAAVEALSVGLAGLDPKDFRFNQIVEQLGGFRQIGKVIPLIKEFATTQNALNVALSSGGSVAQDAETAQQALAVQFEKVGQQFDALIRKFAASEGFGRLAKFAIDAANAFLKFAEVLEDLLPQLAALAAIRIGRGIAPGVGALLGGRGARRNSGGMIHGFSGGGFVPGKGNYDTVPAMLTPGEFVVKKSSAQKLGAGTLQAMNNNRYAGGGYVSTKRLSFCKCTRAVQL
jgi:TP901 family phage tail tape measure protein